MASVGLELITGPMGSGKSYYMAEIIYNALTEGAQVHTNLGLNWKVIREKYPQWVDNIVVLPKDVKDMKGCIRAGHESAPNLLVLDEASLYFYVDDQNKQEEKDNNRKVFEFLVWSRRYGLECYFGTQHTNNLNVKLRRMCQYMTRCSNNNHIPYFAWLFTLRVPGFFWCGDFKRTKFVFDDDSQHKLLTTQHWFNKKIGEFYHTHDLMDSGIQLNKVVTRKKPKRRDQLVGKVIFAGFFLFLFGGAFLAYKSGARLFREKPPKFVKSSESGKAKVSGRFPETAALVRRVPSLRIVLVSGEVLFVGKDDGSRILVKLEDFGRQFVAHYNNKDKRDIEL